MNNDKIKEVIRGILNYFIAEYTGIKNDNTTVLDSITQKIVDSYNQPHRFYHTLEHIQNLFVLISNLSGLSPNERNDLLVIAIFHDIIYDPRKKDNEQLSAHFFNNFTYELQNMRDARSFLEIDQRAVVIFNAILETETHVPRTPISKIFCDLDMHGLNHNSLQEMMHYEYQIFKEFQFAPYNLYKAGRVEFLEKYNSSLPSKNPNIEALVEYIKFRKPKIGLYAGSFNPTHIGHIDILNKAEKIFDKVVMARGINPDKNHAAQSLTPLHEIFPFHETNSFESYIFDYIKHKEATEGIEITLIRGIRNQHDLEYEMKQQKYNDFLCGQHKVPHLRTVFISCSPEFAHISSSDIRAMERYQPGSAEKLIYKPQPLHV